MKRIVAKGLLWVMSTMALVRAVRYLAFLFLGGALEPSDFGKFAVIFVVVNGLALLQGFGLGPALLYRRDRVSESADTVFFVSGALGALFVILAWFGAPFVERFFGEEGLVGPFRVCAFVILFRAFQTVPLRLFEKELNFRSKLVPGLIGSGVYASVALVLASRGAGVWALVFGEVSATFAETSAYWISSRWRPRMRFDLRLALEDLHFGWAVLGGTMLIFAFQSIDRVAISRMMGAYHMGLYAFVFTLSSLPATYLVRSLNTVLLPSYTSDQADAAKRKELYFLATGYTAAFGLLFVVGVFALGGSFLRAVYGEKWVGAINAFSGLALLGFFQSLSSINEDLVVALGKPQVFRGLAALRVALAAAAVWFAARHWGIAGVAYAMAGATAVSCLVGWRSVSLAVGSKFVEYWCILRWPLLAAAASALVARVASPLVPPESGVGRFLAGGSALVVLYMFLWFAFDSELRREWLGRMARVGRARRSADGPTGRGPRR